MLFRHALDGVGPRGQHLGRHQRPDAGVEGAAAGRPRVSRFDHAAAQLGQHLAHGGRLAAPPGVQGGQLQLFAQQAPRERGQKAEQRARFKKARTRRVGHQQVAGAHRLQQAGHTQARFGAHLQRVEKGVVDPLDEAVHRPQAVQRLQVQAAPAHRQIAAFDQRQAQVAREVGVLEVGLVVRPGREQRDVRVLAGRAGGLDALDEAAVSGRQAAHVHALEGIGELGRDGRAVFQQVAQARGRLRALRHHPPIALGSARQIEGDDVQVRAAHHRHAVHGAQVVRVALHQRGGQQAVLQQAALAVGVAHHGFKHLHALQHAGFNGLPVAGRDQQRKQIERPRPLQVGLVGVNVVGDAVFAQLARQACGAAVQFFAAVGAEVLEELVPAGRHRAAAQLLQHRGPLAALRGQAAQLVKGAERRQGRGGMRQGPGLQRVEDGNFRLVHPAVIVASACCCSVSGPACRGIRGCRAGAAWRQAPPWRRWCAPCGKSAPAGGFRPHTR